MSMMCCCHQIQARCTCQLDSASSHAAFAMQGATQSEWKDAHCAAMLLGRRGADLEELMGRSACMLVMEYIPGRPLFDLEEPFQATHIMRTAEDLGRSAQSLHMSFL